ncbi:MAG: Holliday junction branch migration protein RuvA [Bacteroidia bacterium]|nr:Holliday junction branch migration protein RuvA [Bacteroidia bacterium]
MIAYLKGELAHLDPALAIVDCGGVGYGVKISLNTYEAIQGKKQVRLWTHFSVREDAQILYGFAEESERKLFELLISISGVGGNTALMILSSLSPAELYDAIRSEQINTLKGVKGIGAKTAGRIVLELKDKIELLGATASGSTSFSSGSGEQKKQDALQALQQLGMPKATMVKRVEQIIKDSGSDVSVEEIIKLALRNG